MMRVYHMKANEGTGRNPEDCKKIARCLNCASDRSDPKLARRGEQKKDDKSRKARPKGLPRSYIGYWKEALRVCPVTGNYFVQISCNGQRGRFTFERNEEIAAEKARKIFLTIQQDGWEVARERYAQTAATRFRNRKEKTRVIALEGRIDDPTVGDLLRVAKETSEVRLGTFHRYEADLRFIVSQVFSVPHTKEVPVPAKKRGKRGNRKPAVRTKDVRYDYASGGLNEWRAAVDSIKLSSFTPEKVESWRIVYLEKAGDDPEAKNHARVSYNRNIRNAKSLFGKKILPALNKHLVLPCPLPFDGVHKEKEPPMRYQSRFDPKTLLAQAKQELEPENPEAYKALLLCLLLGLRRNEADTLLREKIDFALKQLTIEPTKYYALKSPDSARVITLDDDMIAILRGWCDHGAGPFIMESPLESRPMAPTRVYRCERTFRKLIVWLRAHGVTAAKPIHELRKEAGTILLMQGVPIEAVSRFLGHANIAITIKLYADLLKGRRATMKVAALMTPAAVVPSEDATPDEKQNAKKETPINGALFSEILKGSNPSWGY